MGTGSLQDSEPPAAATCLAGAYLLSGPAAYRIDADDGDTLTLTVLRGSLTVVGRTCRVPRHMIAIEVRDGDSRVVRALPAERPPDQTKYVAKRPAKRPRADR